MCAGTAIHQLKRTDISDSEPISSGEVLPPDPERRRRDPRRRPWIGVHYDLHLPPPAAVILPAEDCITVPGLHMFPGEAHWY
ncbi:unnamed protein product [Linum tenue]|uniref:Uncharacterized protein n=1 Tax=Linum tenue TaxID=586396 RepID=A0AAV0RIK3_9ROSI|nr:unnamed protein product [Linum tenue]